MIRTIKLKGGENPGLDLYVEYNVIDQELKCL